MPRNIPINYVKILGFSSQSYDLNGTGATATVSYVVGTYTTTHSVSSVTITNPGSGYTNPPTVIFSPSEDGTTATGVAVVASDLSGTITGVTITNPGTGYLSVPTITFGGPGAGASGTVVLDSGTTTYRDRPESNMMPTISVPITATMTVTQLWREMLGLIQQTEGMDITKGDRFFPIPQ